MAAPRHKDSLLKETIAQLEAAGGNRTLAAKAAGINLGTFKSRLYEAKARGMFVMDPPGEGFGWTFPKEKRLTIDTGSVVVFSDAHYWPGEPSPAHRALLSVIKDIKPRAVIANGDVFDGGTIGRHRPFGWSERPGPVDELHACQERLGEIEQAIPRGCQLLYTATMRPKASRCAVNGWPIPPHSSNTLVSRQRQNTRLTG